MDSNTIVDSNEHTNVWPGKRRKRTWSAPSTTLRHVNISGKNFSSVEQKDSVEVAEMCEANNKALYLKWIACELPRLFPTYSFQQTLQKHSFETISHQKYSTDEHSCNIESTNTEKENLLHETDLLVSVRENEEKKKQQSVEISDIAFSQNNHVHHSDKKNVANNNDSLSNNVNAHIKSHEESLENKNCTKETTFTHSNSCKETSKSNGKLESTTLSINNELENTQKNMNEDDKLYTSLSKRNGQSINDTEVLKAKLEVTETQMQLSKSANEQNISSWNVIEQENKWLREQNVALKDKIERLKYQLDNERLKVEEQNNIIRTLQRKLSVLSKEEVAQTKLEFAEQSNK